MAAKIRLRTALRTDTRIKFMNEIIQGVQVIKMYAWEVVFAARVSAVRRKELAAIRQSSWIRATLLSFHVLPQVAIFLSFVTYAYFNQDSITARKAFIVIAYFNALRASLVDFWPLAIASVAEGYVSVRRVEEFLLAAEQDATWRDAPPDGAEKQVELIDVTAGWTNEPTIKNISLKFHSSGLYVIVGQVGAGKSTMLQVILRELEPSGGKLSINGRISYASQLPWIFQGTIRDNILFNEDFDEKRYAFGPIIFLPDSSL